MALSKKPQFLSGPGEQLPMFMTAREIKTQFAPLDGDRLDVQEDEAFPRQGAATHRMARTDGSPNGIRPPDPRQGQLNPKGEVMNLPRFRRGTWPEEHEETDDQLWSRKLAESKMTRRERLEDQGETAATPDIPFDFSPTPVPRIRGEGSDTYFERNDENYYERGESWQDKQREQLDSTLYSHLSSGQFPGVVSLGHAANVDLHGNQWGENAKQVVGGHHRVAAMSEIAPDQLLPVEHFNTITEAQFEMDPTTGKTKKDAQGNSIRRDRYT